MHESIDTTQISSPEALAKVSGNALKYWSTTRYSYSDIHSVGSEIDNNRYAGIARFSPSEPLNFIISTRVAKEGHGHANTWKKFLEDVVACWNGPPLEGDVIIWMEDGMMDYNNQYSHRAPIIAVCRDVWDQQTMLTADPAFTASRGYEADLENLDSVEEYLSYTKKTPTVFWRGAASGVGITDHRWEMIDRVVLCKTAQNIGKTSLIDAKISKLIKQPDPIINQRLRDSGIVGDYVPFLDFLKYRYQLDVDGMCCAYVSFFLKLYSKSLVIKTNSNYLQWYYYWLKPWQHFVPVKKDFSNLEEIIAWIHKNDEKCAEIARASREFIKNISYKDVCYQTAYLLNELFKNQAR